MIYDCAIIGAGPAGIISSIQLKRFGFKVILFEKNKVGGLARNANKIENYLGFPSGIPGKEFIALLKKQISSFGIKPIETEVSNIKKGDIFEIRTKKGCYKSHAVIIATGTIPKKAWISGEEELCGKKVFYEVADIPLTAARKDILIIGGGDAAFDYAINLNDKGHSPSIIMRNEPACLKLLLKTAQKKKILYFKNSNPLCLYKDGDKIAVECGNKTFKADFILIAVGREPTCPRIDCDDKNGLFLAGDVRNGKYRQIHISTGDALQTTIKVQEYLKNANNTPKRK